MFVQTLSKKFGQDFEVEVQAKFEVGDLEFGQFFSADVLQNIDLRRILVEILKLGLVKILNLKFYGEADVWLRF